MSSPALGHSVSLEGSAGGGAAGVGLLADVELRPFETFLSLGYFWSQPRALEASSEADSVVLAPAPLHALSLGLDHALNDQWLLSALLTGQLPSGERVPLGPEGTSASRVALSTGRSSLGAVLAVGADGLSSDWAFDASCAATAFRLWHGLELPTRGPTVTHEWLGVVRPGVGLAFRPGAGTRLSVRGTYAFYTADPLQAGGFSDAELESLLARGQTVGTLLQRALRRNPQLGARLSLADAASGYTGAPVRWELRGAVSQKLSTQVRVDVTYAFMRYVPTLGHAQLLALRGRWEVTSDWALWATASGQLDFEESSGALSLEPLWLGGGGVEWEF